MSITATPEEVAALFPSAQRKASTEEALEGVYNARKFLLSCGPLEYDDEALELAVMHVAYLVDEKNAFFNNVNIKPERKALFIEHMSMMKESDVEVWCRKLYDSTFWNFSNAIVTNLIYNWIIGSLNTPRSLI